MNHPAIRYYRSLSPQQKVMIRKKCKIYQINKKTKLGRFTPRFVPRTSAGALDKKGIRHNSMLPIKKR